MPSAPVIWKSPILLKEDQIIPIGMSDSESKLIAEYTEKYFPKKYIDQRPSQWNALKGKGQRNPNEIGIRGEWAGTKYLQKKPKILDFLVHRPWLMSDFGDIALKGKRETLIFDFKTRTTDAPADAMIANDYNQGIVADKFVKDEFRYLQAFIFCADDYRNKIVRVVGWMRREEFFAKSIYVPPNTPAPYHVQAYERGMYVIPYRRLHPMEDLLACKSVQITEALTHQMRADFKKGVWDGVEPYIAGMLQSLPATNGSAI